MESYYEEKERNLQNLSDLKNMIRKEEEVNRTLNRELAALKKHEKKNEEYQRQKNLNSREKNFYKMNETSPKTYF